MSFYDEIAVSGSVARGIADQYSDCEVVLWVSQLQPPAVYKRWLESLGRAVRLLRESPDGDVALYLEYDVDGVQLDAIWQRWSVLDTVMAALETDRLPPRATDVWMLAHLIPLGTASRLRAYQSQVSEYPDRLRRNLIEGHLSEWRWRSGVFDVFIGKPAAWRGQLYELRRRQLSAIGDLFFMLFAYNRLWLPEAKWYREEAARMTHQPPRLIERMDLLLSERDPATLLATMRRLMVDTLTILAGEFEVGDLIAGLEAIDLDDE